jgi:hypothetical protein
MPETFLKSRNGALSLLSYLLVEVDFSSGISSSSPRGNPSASRDLSRQPRLDEGFSPHGQESVAGPETQKGQRGDPLCDGLRASLNRVGNEVSFSRLREGLYRNLRNRLYGSPN